MNFELGVDLGQCWHELFNEPIKTSQKVPYHKICAFSSTLFTFLSIKMFRKKLLRIDSEWYQSTGHGQV